MGYAKIKLKITDTNGSDFLVTQQLKKGADLSLISNRDSRLKPYKIVEMSKTDQEPFVRFGNGQTLTAFAPIHFQIEKSIETDPRITEEHQTMYPVFNIIDRASKELWLTRSTILAIFKGIEKQKKEVVFKNPEGFAATFIDKIKEILADHVAEKIEYSINSEYEEFEVEEAFPTSKKIPQKELIDGSKSSMYDQIQIDSDVELRFVKYKLQEEDQKGNLVCYFKFPNTFKVNIPKIIGNYNPDWGIIRLDENGKPTLKLVRETKGNVDTSKLRFTNEGRKIECAEKHFKTIGIDYRTVDDKIERWWLPKII